VLLADLHPPGFQHYHEVLSDMGHWLPAATVAVEDAGFWSEPGIDPLAILRAAYVDLTSRRIVEGGSTITQQLVKMRVVGAQDTLARKIREAILAMQVSRSYSKSEILQMYLNSVYYGDDAYGSAAAAQNFFRVPTARLDLAQASLLAGLPENPYGLDPFTHWSAAKARQQEVLAAMVRVHSITQQQANQAFAENLTPPLHMFPPRELNLAPGFVQYAEQEISATFGSNSVEQGGLTIRTTLNWSLQQQAQKAVTDNIRRDAGYHATDGALVALDPKTGDVLAMVGSAGAGVPGGDYDMAVWPPRNPGSAFKIFTYSAAIASRHYTMVTPIEDAPLTVQPPGSTTPYQPKNYDLRYHGICQVQQCLGNSLNIPAVEVELGTGTSSVVRMARAMGAPPYEPAKGSYTSQVPASSFGPSLTLGSYGETPLQMAVGASVLAAGGALHPARALLSAVDASGQRVYEVDGASGKQVLDPGAAFVVSEMLSRDANRAITFGEGTLLNVAGYRVAAKTGTNENFTDGWTVGYTPELVTAVWVGNTNFSPMSWGADGIVVATPIWHQFMASALGSLHASKAWYQPPPDVVRVAGNWFLDGTSPETPAPGLPLWAHLAWGGSPGAHPGCRSWTYHGGHYWACQSGSSGLPGDPVG
jgi:membrane peptidoglycan carboxypeptidase